MGEHQLKDQGRAHPFLRCISSSLIICLWDSVGALVEGNNSEESDWMDTKEDVNDGLSSDEDYSMDLDRGHLSGGYVYSHGQNQSFEEWATHPNSYKAIRLSKRAFDAYYQESNWTSDHVTLLGKRDIFSGPTLGWVVPDVGALP
jgi:hypothetical protein